ncbi:MAG: hypothetical protein ACRDYY_14845, partial [Acidimicrobiales bacterium]
MVCGGRVGMRAGAVAAIVSMVGALLAAVPAGAAVSTGGPVLHPGATPTPGGGGGLADAVPALRSAPTPRVLSTPTGGAGAVRASGGAAGTGARPAAKALVGFV